MQKINLHKEKCPRCSYSWYSKSQMQVICCPACRKQFNSSLFVFNFVEKIEENKSKLDDNKYQRPNILDDLV